MLKNVAHKIIKKERRREKMKRAGTRNIFSSFFLLGLNTHVKIETLVNLFSSNYDLTESL